MKQNETACKLASCKRSVSECKRSVVVMSEELENYKSRLIDMRSEKDYWLKSTRDLSNRIDAILAALD